MSNSYTYRSYASSNGRREDYHGTSDDVVGGVGPSNNKFSSQKTILVETGNIGGSRHISMVSQHPQWFYLAVGIIHLFIIMFLHLVFQSVMVKVVWVIGTLNSPPIKIIV